MNANHLSRFSRVVLRFYELAQHATIQEFQDAALSDLKVLLPFDSSMWGSATMTDHGIEIHTLHLHNTSMQMIRDYESVKHLDEFAQRVVAQEKATIGFSAQQAQAPELREFLYKYGHMHGLITQSISPETRFVQWLSLFRRRPDHACSEQEIEFLDALFPHLMQSLAINRRSYLAHLAGGDDTRARWPVAIADHHGFLYHAAPQFLDLLSREFEVQSHDRLPSAVMDVFSNSVLEYVGQQTVLIGKVEKDLLFLKARPKVAADNLNSRELLIAKMLASGLSHKEIAQKLNRSPETVRSHGKLIYRKLGASKVTQLSALLNERT